MASSLAWQQLPSTFSSFHSSSTSPSPSSPSSSSSSSFPFKRSFCASPPQPSPVQCLREMRVKAVAEGLLEVKEEPAVAAKFEDPRWKNGNWDFRQFKKDGETDWNAVIDAEVYRRKWLEDNPESSNNTEPVLFETSMIPWWAWVKRFHLPEAELLNGRAAMVGFFMSYFVDALTGVGLVDQMDNFFGKLLLFASVVGVLVVRKNEDVKNIQNLAKEWTFYDRQWQATWQDVPPSGSEKEN